MASDDPIGAALKAVAMTEVPKLARNPYGCGYLPPPGGIYISHCSRHHPRDEVRYGAHGSVTFECGDGEDCPCRNCGAPR